MFERFIGRARRWRRPTPDNLTSARLTDRAHKAMALADQEARRLDHGHLGTEHILLGLAAEGGGVAAMVLKRLGADLSTLRSEVAKRVPGGPDVVVTDSLVQTPRAGKVVEYAIEEARDLNHNYVATEHILLGLLREIDGTGAQVLVGLGLALEDVRQAVLHMLGVESPGAPPPPSGVEQPREADHRSLDVWKKADDLANTVYKVAGSFPKEEVSGVGSHLRRTALLLPPKIAAAYRCPDKAEARWFLNIALNQLQELRYGLDFSGTREYLKSEEHKELADLAGRIEEELREYRDALPKQ